MAKELPTIARSSYSTRASGPVGPGRRDPAVVRQLFEAQMGKEHETPTSAFFSTRPTEMAQAFDRFQLDDESGSSQSHSSSSSKSSKGEFMRRIAQVFIADTNENIALDKGLLFQGEPTFTDLTDEELFFELDMKSMLEVHNAVRLATLDKRASKTSGRDVYLEPARIRDLNMVVLDIAVF